LTVYFSGDILLLESESEESINNFAVFIDVKKLKSFAASTALGLNFSSIKMFGKIISFAAPAALGSNFPSIKMFGKI
jgi:hypothetical protein